MEASSLVTSACFSSPLLPSAVGSKVLNDRCLLVLPAKPRRTSIVSRLGKPDFSNICLNISLRSSSNMLATEVPTSVPVRVAFELLQAGNKYLDVRTPDDFSSGHAPEAINIPYAYRVGSGMTLNPSFLKDVLSHFGKDDEIIVGCQDGKLSAMAAADLLASGFTGVTNIAGGFSAWTQSGLRIEP